MRSVVLLFAGVLAFVAACGGTTPHGAGSGDGGSDASCVLPPPIGCTTDDTLACSGGATAFACYGDNPALEDPTYTCTLPAACADPCGCLDPWCCFLTPHGFGLTTCVADYALTSVCPPGPDSYGYQCVPGADPTTLDAWLACDLPTPDADGVHNDYCCTLSGDGGSGNGIVGPPPFSCFTDSTIDCSGGGAPYSCVTGANPEEENPTISCSTPQPDATTGGDDYCCFGEPSGEFSPSTCEPDDDISSVCPDADSYGYQCVSGDDPSTLDSSLTNCSVPTPDADGVHDDFCCTYD